MFSASGPKTCDTSQYSLHLLRLECIKILLKTKLMSCINDNSWILNLYVNKKAVLAVGLINQNSYGQINSFICIKVHFMIKLGKFLMFFFVFVF